MRLASKSSSSSKSSKPYSYSDTSSWILHSEMVLRVTCSSEDTQWTVNSLGLVASAHLFLSSASTSLLSFIAAPPNVRPNNQSFCCRASMKGQIGHQQRFIQQIRRITNINVRVSDRTQASHMPQERRYQIP